MISSTLAETLIIMIASFTASRSSVSFFTAAWSNNKITTTAIIRRRQMPWSCRRTRSSLQIYSSQRILPLQRPPDPSSFSSTNHTNIANNESNYVQAQSRLLGNWIRDKRSVLVITGAGMSTESGIPDYRGSNGSYFRGHKPVIHHEFMSNESTRKRYWARSLVGYSPFSNAQPNEGHLALAQMEKMGLIGVNFIDPFDNNNGLNGNKFDCVSDSCYGPSTKSYLGHEQLQLRQKLSIITQNVDILHSKGGSRHVLHLHGRGDVVRCMNCGVTRDRKEYHEHLSESNRQWLEEVTRKSSPGTDDEGKVDESKTAAPLRPDGDADWYQESYDGMILPPCPHCGSRPDNNEHDENWRRNSFYKTDVVFFGDSVPRHRFDIAYAAIDAADGLLCIGTSLAVHSAYRLAKRAIDRGTEVAILNVGETRIESEGLCSSTGLVTKIESPIGDTLSEFVRGYKAEE